MKMHTWCALSSILVGCGGGGGKAACPDGELRGADGRCHPPAGDPGALPGGTVPLALLTAWSPLGAPPPDPTNRLADDPAAAAWGLRALARLEGAGGGCTTCHDPTGSGEPLIGLTLTPEGLPRAAPGLDLAPWRAWWGWGGACDTLWCAVVRCLENPEGMDGDRASALRALRADPELGPAWTAALGPPALDDAGLAALPDRARPAGGEPAAAWAAVDPALQAAATDDLVTVAKAVAAGLRGRRPGASAFDAYVAAVVAGDLRGGGALTDDEVLGLSLFAGDAGCAGCHGGPGLGGADFAALGLPGGDPGRAVDREALLANPLRGDGAWSDDPAAGAEVLAAVGDEGDGEGAHLPPPLRDVLRALPLRHAHQHATLGEAIAAYADPPATGDDRLQPRDLDEAHIGAIAAFLAALAGAPPDPLTAARRAPAGAPIGGDVPQKSDRADIPQNRHQPVTLVTGR
jgi:cytochrome c peroxidase